VSEEELVSAYSAGRISRRIFIRRLMVAGVSVTTALGYARVLAPGALAADHPDDPKDHHRHHKDPKDGSSSSSAGTATAASSLPAVLPTTVN
jgi:hypothetical protein